LYIGKNEIYMIATNTFRNNRMIAIDSLIYHTFSVFKFIFNGSKNEKFLRLNNRKNLQ
jgi:hypothetical protein